MLWVLAANISSSLIACQELARFHLTGTLGIGIWLGSKFWIQNSDSFPFGKDHFSAGKFVLWRLATFMNSVELWKVQTVSVVYFFVFTNSRCGWILLLCCVLGSKNLLYHFTLVKLSHYLPFTENSVLYFKHPQQQDHLSCKASGWRFWREDRKTGCLRGYCSCGCSQVSAPRDTAGHKMHRAEGTSTAWGSLGCCHHHLSVLGQLSLLSLLPTLPKLLEKSNTLRSLNRLICSIKEKWYY